MPDTSRYDEAGVSTRGADAALEAIKRHLGPTHHFNLQHPVKLDLGYFANVIELGGGLGLAFCTDGVGTKVLVAEMLGRYDTLGIDCVAMNVNDLICVGARPVSLVDYIACSHTDPEVFDQLARGLAEGARQARISIAGGEISQVREIVQGIDLIGSAVGLVPLERINTGRSVRPGQWVLGLASTGIHSNGLTLARRVLLGESPEEQRRNARTHEAALGTSLGEALLTPTAIYVQAVLALMDLGIPLHAVVHLTGGGVCNLNRVSADGVRFVLDRWPPHPPLFRLIQERGQVPDSEMFQVFNMGIGLILVVEDWETADVVLTVCEKFNHPGWIIGRVEAGEGRSVLLPQPGLLARGSEIHPA